ncbi:L domain-like protein, partial [Fragilariopsis cylindrus CCMP1102]
MEIGSGFEFALLEVKTTGYYRVALRYNYNEKSAISLHMKIDDTEKGQFDLISTGNKTTWMVDGIDNILLSQGEHVVRLSVLSETDDGPHIDWLTVSMLEPVSRFDYLVILLAELTDITTPSQSQISALVWMASEDPMDWSSLTDQEIIERYALVQIYYSASGDIWFNTNEWLSQFHVCTWYGIACSKEELVTDLMLDNNGLEGRIPIELFLLTNLILISLDTNSLEGTIPTEIKKLKKLTKLFMQANFLSGLLPSALGSLEYITNIDLRANDFNGQIPEEIYSITSIEALALSSNDLEGTLSTNIGALTSLRDLSLQNNKLSGTIPTTLGTLTSLTTLVLGYNQFSGSIPSEL